MVFLDASAIIYLMEGDAASLLVSDEQGHFVTGDRDFAGVPGLQVREVRSAV